MHSCTILRSIFYSWSDKIRKWVFDNFPQLESQLTGVCRSLLPDTNPISSCLLALCSGPGYETERMKFLKDILETAQRQEHHDGICTLFQDDRKHTALFYTICQRRMDMFKAILEHEKKWYVTHKPFWVYYSLSCYVIMLSFHQCKAFGHNSQGIPELTLASFLLWQWGLLSVAAQQPWW